MWPDVVFTTRLRVGGSAVAGGDSLVKPRRQKRYSLSAERDPGKVILARRRRWDATAHAVNHPPPKTDCSEITRWVFASAALRLITRTIGSRCWDVTESFSLIRNKGAWSPTSSLDQITLWYLSVFNQLTTDLPPNFLKQNAQLKELRRIGCKGVCYHRLWHPGPRQKKQMQLSGDLRQSEFLIYVSHPSTRTCLRCDFHAYYEPLI